MTKSILAATLLTAVLAPISAQAQGVEISGNAGWLSQYYYRGIPQKTSSANTGLNLALGDLGIGTWAADVGDGAELDLFASYGLSLGDFSLSLGGTGYFYTAEFDDTYLEYNLAIGRAPLDLGFAIGQYRTSPTPVNYWFLSATVADESGFFATLGLFGGDDDFSPKNGEYVEAGYGWPGAGLDFSISGIWSDETLSGAVDAERDATHELTFVFGVSKTFSIR